MKSTAEDEQKQPTLADLIEAAKEAEIYAERKRTEESMARNAATDASNKARQAWDGIYAELAKMKEANKGNTGFRESKLGKLLENVRS